MFKLLKLYRKKGHFWLTTCMVILVIITRQIVNIHYHVWISLYTQNSKQVIELHATWVYNIVSTLHPIVVKLPMF